MANDFWRSSGLASHWPQGVGGLSLGFPDYDHDLNYLNGLNNFQRENNPLSLEARKNICNNNSSDVDVNDEILLLIED